MGKSLSQAHLKQQITEVKNYKSGSMEPGNNVAGPELKQMSQNPISCQFVK